jgi:hypothetical protein
MSLAQRSIACEEIFSMSNSPTPLAQSAGNHTLALLSLLLGVLAFVPPIGIIASPVAITLGIIAIYRSRYTQSRKLTRSLAIAGITVAALNIIVYVFVVLAFIHADFKVL